MKSRFVILEHDWPALHWDLFVEDGDALRGWRLLESPFQGVPVPVEVSSLHRKDYLDYQGPVSDRRGTVKRVYEGVVDSLEGGDSFHFIERGGRLHFEWKQPSLGG